MSDIDQYEKWCREARKLLKVQGLFSKLRNKDHDTMMERNADVASRLRDMEASPLIGSSSEFKDLFQKFHDRYGVLAAKCHTLDKSSSDAIKAVSKDLEILRLEIAARSSDPGTAVDDLEKRRGKLVKASTEAFKKAERKAYQQINDAAQKEAVPAALLESARSKIKAIVGKVELLATRVTVDSAEKVNRAISLQAELLAKNIQADIVSAKNEAARLQATMDADRAAIPEYTRLLREAEDARKEIEQLDGATPQFVRIQKLIGTVRSQVKTDGELLVGCAQTLPMLKQVSKIREEALTAAAAFLSQPLSADLQDAVDKVQAAIAKLESSTAAFAIPGRASALAGLQRRAKLGEDAAKLKAELQELESAITGETTEAKEQKKRADKLLTELESDLTDLPSNVKGRIQVVNKLGNIKAVMSNRDWEAAETALAKVKVGMQAIKARWDEFGVKWAPIETQLQKMLREFPQAARSLPDTAAQASPVWSSIQRILGEFKKTGSYKNAVDDFEKSGVAAGYQALAQLTLPSNAEFEILRSKKIEYEDEVRILRDATNKVLGKLAAKLKGLANPQQTPLNAEVSKAFEVWRAGCLNAKTEAVLEKARDKAKEDLEKATATATNLLKSKVSRADYQDLAKNAESARVKDDLPAHIADLIDQLERHGQDVASERTRLAKLKAITDQDETVQQGKVNDLERQERDVMARLDTARTAQEETVDDLLERGDQLSAKLKKIKIPSDSKELRNALKNDCLDLDELANSGDPDLIKLGQQAADELDVVLASVAGKKAFAEVTKVAKQCSKLVGSKELKKYKPDTQQRLFGELQAAIVESKRSMPVDALKKLNDVKAKLDTATTEAVAVKTAHEAFQVKRKHLEATWKSVRQTTSTQFTERATHFQKALDARLVDADAMLKAEGGVAGAQKIVQGLIDDLERINALNPNEARAELQKMDGQYQQIEKRVIRLAEQFNAEYAAFKNGLLTQVIAHTAKLGDGDVDTARSLGMVAKSARKVVKPYLQILKTLGRGAQHSPELGKAQTDFGRARGMLKDAAKTAQRMLGMSSSTNVVIHEDFQKVEANWKKQVTNYNDTVTRLSKSLSVAAQDLKTGPNPIDATAEKNIKAAAAAVDKASKMFAEDAFMRPFVTLSAAANPAIADSQKKEKKAAREQALRTMRQLRTQLVTNPLLIGLTDKSNPFDQARMMAAAGTLRASLKRIQLESLIGA